MFSRKPYYQFQFLGFTFFGGQVVLKLANICAHMYTGGSVPAGFADCVCEPSTITEVRVLGFVLMYYPCLVRL